MNLVRAVRLGLLACVLLFATVVSAQIAPVAQVPLSPTAIPQFAQPLPVLFNGIPVVADSSYKLSMCEFKVNILPAGSLGKKTAAPDTWVWGYRVGATCPGQAAAVADSYIGPVVVASRGTPTEVTYVNQLGDSSTTHVLAYQQGTDQTLMWADPLNPAGTNAISGINGPSEQNFCNDWVKQNPGAAPTGYCAQHYAGPIAAAPHLHGGEIPAMLDGGPDAWWTGTGLKGHGFYSKAEALTGEAIYRYPNVQEAAPIWFHDHTLGATRLNVYAGIAGAYMVVDPNFSPPAGMTALGLQNGAADANGPTQEPLIPVVLQDRMFDVNGQLLFPNLGINLEHPFWIPEFVGDTIVVNGKAWPFHNVEPKRYRFLFLNGSNARTYELFLINKATSVKGPALYVIGTDQGYLDAPAKIDPNVKPNNVLVMMPGERYEVVIDFGGLPAGTKLLLANSGKTPYPAGGPPKGSTVARIMEFRVGACTSGFCTDPANPALLDTSYNPAAPTPIRTMVRLADPVLGTAKAGTTIDRVRRLTLNEVIAAGGPVEILVNNTPYTGAARLNAFTGGADFTPITTQWNTTYYSELPNEGETELWEIVNLTADAHPIHPHLVAFQLMNRQALDVKNYSTAYAGAFPGMLYIPGYGPPLDYSSCGGGTPVAPCVGGNPDPAPFLVGAAVPPLPNEAGWKDTVMAMPGQVTRFLVRFAPTTLANTTAADDAFYDFDPNHGHGYVWHCHIIDHEDNEMMRPFSVSANPNAAESRTFVMGVDY